MIAKFIWEHWRIVATALLIVLVFAWIYSAGVESEREKQREEQEQTQKRIDEADVPDSTDDALDWLCQRQRQRGLLCDRDAE